MAAALALPVLPTPGMPLELSDAELAALVVSRESRAEAALFARFAKRVELYGRKHLRSQPAADDLVQQVMLIVLEAVRAGKVEDPTKLASFVLGTCRNVTWDLRRAAGRQQRYEREVGSDETAVSPPSTSELDVLRLRSCMGALPEREMMVVRMTFLEDQTAEEVGARLGLSAGNVRVIRHRALAKLSHCLDAKEAS
ncbi:MAG TPA: sigma-70 family RNA polymerase sigma factor [Polyangiaceae bacterium]|jgi:RNA polymerase sigma-70 factor (ECF subfamily)|nr:sigma-70 family RNA polymerase sigma factor [Polyangiaceae bacterium]